ncbi:MAG: uncharacterized membrane protein YuzA (DUF378 family), partial [Polaribacter sp.]
MMNKIKKIIILLIVVIAVITALNWEKI